MIVIRKYHNVGAAQSLLEYTLLISIVATAFIMMQIYVQRAVRAQLKVIEQQLTATQ